jgi:hypothetical protein
MSVRLVVLFVAVSLAACHAQPRRAEPERGGIAGQVRDRLTGEAVTATLTAHDQDSFVVDTAHTAADGSYAIADLAPGVYDMVVVLKGTTLQLTDIPVRAGHVTAFDVPVDIGAVEVPPVAYAQIEGDALKTYQPPGLDPEKSRLEGTVTDSVSRERVAGAVVVATSPDLSEVLTVVSDDRGRFRFPDGPPATYTLSAFYQVARRGQIEVRRSGVEAPPGTAVIVPIFIEVTGTE